MELLQIEFAVPTQQPLGTSRRIGRTGIAAQARAQTGSGNVYTPSFLQEQGAIPIGADNPAAESFFRTSVLPFSDLNDLVLKNGIPQVGRTLEKAASRVNPLLLALPELAAGRQFSTGRKISDLESPTRAWTGTENPVIDRAIHYSPLSRLVSEERAIEDARKTPVEKAISLSGAGKVSTYPTDLWKLRDMRDAVEKQQAATPGAMPWTDYFLPQENQQTMPPEETAKFKASAKYRAQLIKQIAAMRKQHAGVP